MESTGSNSPATDTSLQSPAPIRGERKKLAARQHGRPSSSRPSARAPSRKVIIIIPEFQCMYCPHRSATVRGRAGHESVHRHLRALRQKQKQKERRRLAPADGPQLRVSASRTRMHYFPAAGSARSSFVPLFAGAGAAGLVSAQPSSAAPGAGTSRQVNQERTAQCYSWLRSFGVSSSVLPQPAALAPVAEGDGAAGDGIPLGGLQAIPDLNQEAENIEDIDLTLRL